MNPKLKALPPLIRWILVSFLGFLLLLAVLSALLYLRLSFGPIALGFLLPGPVEWTDPAGVTLRFEAEETELSLDSDTGDFGHIVVRFRNAMLESSSHGLLATVPDLSAGLSWQTATGIWPTLGTLTIRQARIAAVDSASGRESARAPPQGAELVRLLFAMPAGATVLADPEGPAGRINRLRIADLRIDLSLGGGDEWRIPEAALDFERENGGLVITGNVVAGRSGGAIPISIRGLYDNDRKVTETTLDFGQTIPTGLLSDTPLLLLPHEAWEQVRLHLQVTADDGASPARISAHLSSGLGELSAATTPPAADGAFAVQGALRRIATEPLRRMLGQAAFLVDADRLADGAFEGVIGEQGDIRKMTVEFPAGRTAGTAAVSSRLLFSTAIDGTLENAAFEVATPFGAVRGDAETLSDGGIAFSGRLERVRIARILERFPPLGEGTAFSLSAAGSFSGTINGPDRKDTLNITLAGVAENAPSNVSRDADASTDGSVGTDTGNSTEGNAEENTESVRTVPVREGTAPRQPGLVCGRPSEPELRDASGPSTKVAVAIARGDDGIDISVDASTWNIPAADLKRYWPRILAPNAEDWLAERVLTGIVEEARLRAALAAPPSEGNGVSLSELGGEFCYRGLTVDYFPGMPPVTDARGKAVFGMSDMHIDVADARAPGIHITDGRVSLTELFGDRPEAAISMTMQTPLKTALRVLSEPPLDIVGETFTEGPALGSAAAIDLNVRFPVFEDLRVGEIMFSGSVALSDGRQGGVPDGKARFRLSGAPRKDFPGLGIFSGDGRNHYIMRGAANLPFAIHLGLPDTGRLSGEGRYEVRFSYGGGAPPETVARVDLDGVSVALPELGWRKPANAPGTFHVKLSSDPNGTALIRFSAEAGNFEGAGRVLFDPGFAPGRGTPWHAEIERFSLPGSRIRGRIDRGDGDSWNIVLDADPLNLEPSSKLLSEDGDDAPDGLGDIPITLRLQARNVRIGPKETLSDLRINSVLRDGRLHRLDIDARRNGESLLLARIADGVPNGKAEIRSSSAGALLKTLGLYEDMAGGAMTMTGAREKPGAPWRGRFEMMEYSIRNAPALAHLLQLVSLTGPINLLLGDGLRFNKLEGEFAYDGGTITLTDTITAGNSLGITAEGRIDIEGNALALSGSVIPAYTSNRLLGQVPVLGPLLSGGRGEGILGFDYKAEGPLDDVKMRVNPLSALIPGLVKRMFRAAGKEQAPADGTDTGGTEAPAPGSPDQTILPPGSPDQEPSIPESSGGKQSSSGKPPNLKSPDPGASNPQSSTRPATNADVQSAVKSP